MIELDFWASTGQKRTPLLNTQAVYLTDCFLKSVPDVDPRGKYSTEQNNANSRHNNTRSVWCKEEDLYRNDSLNYEERDLISRSDFLSLF